MADDSKAEAAPAAAPPAPSGPRPGSDTFCKVKSSDDRVFEVRRGVAEMSVTIKNMLEDLDTLGPETEIPLPNVSSKTLEQVINFCDHHFDANTPPRPEKQPWEDPTIELKGYDLELSNKLIDDLPSLFDLILAANYLDIKMLMDVSCQTVANKIIGKTTEELRQIFNIVNDFTPEEEEQVRKDHEWCFPPKK